MANVKGRPRKYNSAEEMQKDIDKYFASCFRPMLVYDKTTTSYKKVLDSEGKEILEQIRPFTVTGLADALDMSRETLLRYGEKDDFSDTVMRAKRKCELYAEERLFDKEGANGAKFSLANNFKDWKDKKDVDANVATQIRVTLDD